MQFATRFHGSLSQDHNQVPGKVKRLTKFFFSFVRSISGQQSSGKQQIWDYLGQVNLAITARLQPAEGWVCAGILPVCWCPPLARTQQKRSKGDHQVISVIEIHPTYLWYSSECLRDKHACLRLSARATDYHGVTFSPKFSIISLFYQMCLWRLGSSFGFTQDWNLGLTEGSLPFPHLL